MRLGSQGSSAGAEQCVAAVYVLKVEPKELAGLWPQHR